MVLHAVLSAVQALARRLTGEALIIEIDRGDGTVWEWSEIGASLVAIPSSLSIAGRINVRWDMVEDREHSSNRGPL
jgi:hypothetical protein